jgi:hypothetical protein
MRPTLPAELAPRLADAVVVATTDLSVPCTVVVVGEEKWPSSSQGRSGMNVAHLGPTTLNRDRAGNR